MIEVFETPMPAFPLYTSDYEVFSNSSSNWKSITQIYETVVVSLFKLS